MRRKTDSSAPADWLFLAREDLDGVERLVEQQIAHGLCRSKLAEILEKTLKAELLRLGWFLQRTHDLEQLLGELHARRSPLVEAAQPLCHRLAEAYFAERYPGFDLDEPNWPLLKEQVGHVAQVIDTVSSNIGIRRTPHKRES